MKPIVFMFASVVAASAASAGSMAKVAGVSSIAASAGTLAASAAPSALAVSGTRASVAAAPIAAAPVAAAAASAGGPALQGSADSGASARLLGKARAMAAALGEGRHAEEIPGSTSNRGRSLARFKGAVAVAAISAVPAANAAGLGGGDSAWGAIRFFAPFILIAFALTLPVILNGWADRRARRETAERPEDPRRAQPAELASRPTAHGPGDAEDPEGYSTVASRMAAIRKGAADAALGESRNGAPAPGVHPSAGTRPPAAGGSAHPYADRLRESQQRAEAARQARSWASNGRPAFPGDL